MKTFTTSNRMQGLTLVELMIALTLGLIVIAALVAVFMGSNRNFRQNEALATMQDNARFALDALSRDLAMAGYWGGVRAIDAEISVRVSAAAAAAVAKASATGDCGPATQAASYHWLFDVATPLVFRNHTLGTATISNDFRCLLPANIQPDTDVLMIRRVSAVDALPPIGAGLAANRFYVKTNRNIASLFRATSATFDPTGPLDCPDSAGLSTACKPTEATPTQQVYAYTPQIYYIRSYLKSNADGTPIYDGLPILCRRYLNDTDTTLDYPAMVEDCLAEGVENLQIEWGISSDGSTVQNYVANPTAEQLLQARTARIHILVRSTSKNVQASNDVKSYVLADLGTPNAWTPPADSPPGPVLRRAFTTTVQLKNL
ncbi:MAG: PilW family protein [Pseudomonadota bacterium]